ncbi:hypothetical protein F9H62_01775 [Vibrio alginolyticus]|nr:hypothetical protein [Vibrio alginolyticus]
MTNTTYDQLLAKAVVELKSMPQFKKVSNVDLIQKIETKDTDVPFSVLVNLAAKTKTPLLAKRDLLTKAASGTVTNVIATVQPSTVQTPVEPFSVYKESVLFDAVATIPLVTGTVNVIGLLTDTIAEATVTDEGDQIAFGVAGGKANTATAQNVTYALPVSNQMLDDSTAVDALEAIVSTKVKKQAAQKAIEALKAIAVAQTTTETKAIDKLEEALLALEDKVARLIVMNKADVLAIDKDLRTAGSPTIVNTGSFANVPVLVSDLADANKPLIITNGAIVMLEQQSLTLGTNADDFTKNLQTMKSVVRVAATEVMDNSVYSVALA